MQFATNKVGSPESQSPPYASSVPLSLSPNVKKKGECPFPSLLFSSFLISPARPSIPLFTSTPMKHSLASIALGALLLSQSAFAGLYSSNDKVIEVTSSTFKSEVIDADVKHLFYSPCSGLVHQPNAPEN